ncbi:hypothetical protein BCV70DRAFT_67669 [Testicularia cyperi]|uniref:Uncharacterized protein n=1 Tax=Testicularia cyperi TaxID=1882483 RepID=A0A317XGY4_9BASI|nr:hypothetical protein BCV70DRAFT_67669 [Testicularia cyperi]
MAIAKMLLSSLFCIADPRLGRAALPGKLAGRRVILHRHASNITLQPPRGPSKHCRIYLDCKVHASYQSHNPIHCGMTGTVISFLGQNRDPNEPMASCKHRNRVNGASGHVFQGRLGDAYLIFNP